MIQSTITHVYMNGVYFQFFTGGWYTLSEFLDLNSDKGVEVFTQQEIDKIVNWINKIDKEL